jgi:hypothetical protein
MLAEEVWRRAASIWLCQLMLINVMVRGCSDIEVGSMSHDPFKVLELVGGVVTLHACSGSECVSNSLEGVRGVYSRRGGGHVDIVIIDACRPGKGHNWRFGTA